MSAMIVALLAVPGGWMAVPIAVPVATTLEVTRG